MDTAVLDRLDTAVITAHRRAKRHTAADVYAGVARAWCQLHHASEHVENPMKTYVVSPEFAQDMTGLTDTDPRDVLAVCARIVSLDDWRLTDRQKIGRPADVEEALDPTIGWWHPLDSTDGLGVHYWRLAVGTIELRGIGPVDAPPEFRIGRFAERERLREQRAMRAATARRSRAGRR